MTKAVKIQGKPAEVSKAEYSSAVEAAQLRDIRLIGCAFNSSPEAFIKSEGCKYVYGCEVSDSFYDDEAKLLTGWVNCDATTKIGRRKIMSLKATYLVVYDIDGEPLEEAALKFVQHVGCFAVYPYFRAHFAEVSSQAGLRMPPLPIMKEGKRRIQAHLPVVDANISKD